MLEVKTEYVIDIEDVEKEFKTHMSEYEFTQMAENGSYVPLNCDDASLEELYEDLEWEAGKGSGRYQRIKNQIQLVEYMRKLGYRSMVLVSVYW